MDQENDSETERTPATSAAKKTAAKKAAAKKVAAKKQISRNHPKILAKLAVQILQLDPKGVPDRIGQGLPVSDPKLDLAFHRALKRADLLLKLAAGDSQEEVHAYQVFREGEEPTTFRLIAERLREAGWKKLASSNTVKKWVYELVARAEAEISRYYDFEERQWSLRFRTPTFLAGLDLRLQRHLRTLLRLTSVSRVIENPDDIAKRLATYLIDQIRNEISPFFFDSGQERLETSAGYSSFADYVLEPPSFEKFADVQDFPKLTKQHLQALAFYFQEMANDPENWSNAVKRLEIIHTLAMRSSNATEATAEKIGQLASLMREPDISTETQKTIIGLATSVASNLRETHLTWHQRDLLRIQPVDKLKAYLKRSRQAMQPESINEDFVVLEKLITILEPNPQSDTSIETSSALAEQFSAILQLVEQLRQDHSESNDDLFKLLGQIKEDLEKQANPPQVSQINLQFELQNFFNRKMTSRVERKIRPYEIFLFAAQNNLLSENLVRRRCDLEAGFIPYPSHWTFLPILAYHGGHPLKNLESWEPPI